jgi:hypothetical protein
VPGSSYGLIDQSTEICHCRDCVGFVRCLGSSGEKFLINKATQMVHFYSSDVTVVRGSEHVGAVKLTAASRHIRCYCRRCGTPLGVQATNPVPVVLLYHQCLTGDELPVYLPSLVLNFDSALPGTRRYGGSAVVRRGKLAPWLIVRAVGRVVLGFAFGKSVNGLLPPGRDESTIAVGLESIEIDKAKDQ